VKQGCLLSGLLFLLVIDWLMKRVTENGSLGVRWIGEEILEDLDYADNLGLVSENFEDTQEKMNRLAEEARVMGLKVSAKKTEILRINTKDDKKTHF
jgi:sensor histidine kinase YesM